MKCSLGFPVTFGLIYFTSILGRVEYKCGRMVSVSDETHVASTENPTEAGNNSNRFR